MYFIHKENNDRGLCSHKATKSLRKDKDYCRVVRLYTHSRKNE